MRRRDIRKRTARRREVKSFDPSKLKSVREDCDLSQGSLATAIGKSRQTVWNWENGKSSPSVMELSNLASVLDRPIEAFLTAREA